MPTDQHGRPSHPQFILAGFDSLIVHSLGGGQCIAVHACSGPIQNAPFTSGSYPEKSTHPWSCLGHGFWRLQAGPSRERSMVMRPPSTLPFASLVSLWPPSAGGTSLSPPQASTNPIPNEATISAFFPKVNIAPEHYHSDVLSPMKPHDDHVRRRAPLYVSALCDTFPVQYHVGSPCDV
jgi:hypothetical protein